MPSLTPREKRGANATWKRGLGDGVALAGGLVAGTVVGWFATLG